MAVMIGSARIDENGRATGGKAGDQTGREVATQAWYPHAKGWRVLRAKDPAARERLAVSMENACKNDLIGYDQNQRETLRLAVAGVGWDVTKLTKAAETDCSALVRVCCAYAFGRDIVAGLTSYFNTATMCAALIKTGLFDELTEAKYAKQSGFLRRGDILCTRTQGHTVIVLTDGPNVEKTYALGDRLLKRGMTGADVKALQEALNKISGAGLEADGDFGRLTEAAVKVFQRAKGLTADGEYGPKTRAALEKALAASAKAVRVTGGAVNVRSAPGLDGKVLGVARRGDLLPYGGETSGKWLLVEYANQNGWISGLYAEVEG